MVKQKSAKMDDRALAFHYRDHMHTWRLAYEKSEKRATSAESELTTLRAELLEARKRPKKMSDYDRGVIVGVGLACSIIMQTHDQPVACAEALGACALNRAKLKRAGLEDFDLKNLRPVFRDMKL